MRRIVLLAAAAALLAGAAAAGPQYLGSGRFAAAGYDVVALFDAAQAPLGAAQPAPTPGRAAIVAEHNGATFAFATEANRARFLADPAAFAPQFDGHCAWAAANGYKAPGDPQQWRVVDGRLYFNYSAEVARMWERDIPGHVSGAAEKWPGVPADPAATDDPPELPTRAAPIG